MNKPVLLPKFDLKNAPRKVKREAKIESTKFIKKFIPIFESFLARADKVNNYDFSTYSNPDTMFELVYAQLLKETNLHFINVCSCFKLKYWKIETYYFQNYMRFDFDKK